MFTTLYRTYILAQCGFSKPFLFLAGEIIPANTKAMAVWQATCSMFDDVAITAEFEGKTWAELSQLMMAHGGRYADKVLAICDK